MENVISGGKRQDAAARARAVFDLEARQCLANRHQTGYLDAIVSRLTILINRLFGENKTGRKTSEDPREELGMTSGNEQTFCRNYARELYTGAGEIVDLGCWLGATTVSFSKGLRRNPRIAAGRKSKRIHSYDLFRWHPTMDREVKGTPLEGKYRDGDSFLPEFEKRTASWSEYFRVNAGDIKAAPWTGGPIELLFVDAMKWPDTAAYILKDFYPHLIPGVSLVAHQDFGDFYTGWIHLIQYRLRDYFEFFQEVKKSATVVFRLKTAIPPALLEQDCFLDHASQEEIAAAFDYSSSLVSPSMQERVTAGRAMAHFHRGEPELAKKVMLDFILGHLGSYRFQDRRSVMVEFYGEYERRLNEAAATPR
jgi:Methyltransferase domain